MAFSFLLRSDLNFIVLVKVVHIAESALVFVEVCAEYLIALLLRWHFNLCNGNGHEFGTISCTIIGILQRSSFILLTLHTVPELLASVRTSWTLLAKLARVSAVLCRFAFADAALADSVTGTDLSVLDTRQVTGGIRFLTGAIRTVPTLLTTAFSAVADSVIGTAAQFAVVSFAGEVVAFAVIAINVFVFVLSWMTFATSAGALTSSGTFDLRGAVRMDAAGGFVLQIGEAIRRALAVAAEGAFHAIADAAHVGAVIVALGCIKFETLQQNICSNRLTS